MGVIVYVDTETTGLDRDRHEVWEIAFAVEDGPIVSGMVHHSLRHADADALLANGYHRRPHRISESIEPTLRTALAGATMCAANPAFDAGMLTARWGYAPWHYRLFDVEAYAAGVLRHETPRSLRDIAAELAEMGYDVPQPNHTAAGDVATLRACHRSLVRYRLGLDASLRS